MAGAVGAVGDFAELIFAGTDGLAVTGLGTALTIDNATPVKLPFTDASNAGGLGYSHGRCSASLTNSRLIAGQRGFFEVWFYGTFITNASGASRVILEVRRNGTTANVQYDVTDATMKALRVLSGDLTSSIQRFTCGLRAIVFLEENDYLEIFAAASTTTPTSIQAQDVTFGMKNV